MNTISGSSDRSGHVSADYSVLSLNRRVSDLLDTAFPPSIWLRGILTSTPKVNSRGHMYFQLAESSADRSGQPAAVIDCALFAGSRIPIVREFARRALPFELLEGSEVRLEGRVTLWDKGGRYQFIVQRVDPDWAAGEQVAALRRLVDLFAREDILGANAELTMPIAPLRVGLITSEGSAACEDFLHGLRESGFPFRVFAAWAPMQGTETSAGVLRAFRTLLQVPDLDAVVLTRGGGSPTDLGWFNDEHIGRMISQVPWPVISGIGHETDNTLPDFVAHTRAKTPTHAADILVDTTAHFMEDLTGLARLLHRSTSATLHRESTRLAAAGGALRRVSGSIWRSGLRDINATATWLTRCTRARLESAGNRLDRLWMLLTRNGSTDHTTSRRRALAHLQKGLENSINSRLRTSNLLLDSLSAQISGRDPARLYRSGWATLRNDKGKRIRSVSEVGTSEHILVRVADGSIGAVINEIHAAIERDEEVIPEGADNDR